MSQIGVPAVGVKYTPSEAARWLYGRTNGIFAISDTELKVETYSGRTVKVNPGGAVLTPSKFQSTIYTSSESEFLDIDIGDSVLPRTDLIAIRWRVTVSGTMPRLIVIKGTPSANANIPAFERDSTWDLVIAKVRMPAGSIEVRSEYIDSSLRYDEYFCGLVSDGVVRIPTQALIDQWNFWFTEFTEENTLAFDEWFETIRDILDENTAAHLLNLINEVNDAATNAQSSADLAQTSASNAQSTASAAGSAAIAAQNTANAAVKRIGDTMGGILNMSGHRLNMGSGSYIVGESNATLYLYSASGIIRCYNLETGQSINIDVGAIHFSGQSTKISATSVGEIEPHCSLMRVVNQGHTALSPLEASNVSLPSAKKYKKNIQKAPENICEKLLDMEVVTFDYKNEFMSTGKQIGMIADDVEKIDDRYIYYSESEVDGVTQRDIEGINYTKLVPALLQLVQQQQKRLDELERIVK